MEYKNLDKALAFQDLMKIQRASLKNNLTPRRIREYSATAGAGVTYNYAAMPVNSEIIAKLQELCDEMELVEKYVALLSGEMMNPGEKRLVLHQLTRGNCTGSTVIADGEDKGEFYAGQLEKIRDFSDKVRSGKIKGSTGKRFDTVCQIGIGGSDLGPRALYLALKGWAAGDNVKQLRAEFISNVDPDDAASVLRTIDPERTLFVLVSKSGTTLETLTNQLLVTGALKGIDPSRHFVAVTSKTSPLAKSDDMLESFFIDDYIGGRYSSTSAVGGVILSLTFGYSTFERLLTGAHEADENALNGDITKNAAMMDAAIGVYLRNVLGYGQTAILPYSQALSRFPAHLQQLDMESNGKYVNRFGEKVAYATGPVIFQEEPVRLRRRGRGFHQPGQAQCQPGRTDSGLRTRQGRREPEQGVRRGALFIPAVRRQAHSRGARRPAVALREQGHVPGFPLEPQLLRPGRRPAGQGPCQEGAQGLRRGRDTEVLCGHPDLTKGRPGLPTDDRAANREAALFMYSG